MKRRFQDGGLNALDEDEDGDSAVMDPDADEETDYTSQPGGAVTAAGGLAALDIPGAAEAFRLMQKSSADARKALQDARESIMARQYGRADALLAASAALGAPTRTGSTAESFGAMAGALRGPLAARREFETQKQKDLLGVNTQLSGLDEREATARLALAQLRARLQMQGQNVRNERVVMPDGTVEYRAPSVARTPGTKAWTPPAQSINLNQKQESASETAIGKGLGEQFNNIQQRGLAAGDEINTYDRLESLLDGVHSGKLKPTMIQIAAIADSLGLKIDDKLGPEQAAEALTNELALKLRDPSGGAGMPGALSNSDREYLKQMAPGLGKTAEGNALMMETGRKLAYRKMEIAELAEKYYEKHGKLDIGLYKEIRDYANSHPLFPKKAAAAAPAAKAPPPAAAAAPAAPTVTAEETQNPDDTAPARAPPEAEAELRANPTDQMKRFFIETFGYLPDGIPL